MPETVRGMNILLIVAHQVYGSAVESSHLVRGIPVKTIPARMKAGRYGNAARKSAQDTARKSIRVKNLDGGSADVQIHHVRGMMI